jgi:predicted membrane channel-forming protein YqfA (hemolysin III family)
MKKIGCFLFVFCFLLLFAPSLFNLNKSIKSDLFIIAFLCLLIGSVSYIIGVVANHFRSSSSSNLDSDDDLNQRLEEWKQARRKNLTRKELSNTKVIALFKAAKANRTISIRYNAGDNPGTKRKIIPKQLFKVEGFRSIYLQAYDLLNKEDRTFKIRHIEIV